MNSINFTQTRLFKYFGPEGAKKTLSTGGLRLSHPLSFNDPFDMRIDDLLGLDLRQFLEMQKSMLIELVEGLDPATLRSTELGQKAALIQQGLSRASPEQKKAMRDEFLATPLERMYDFDRMEEQRRQLIGQVKDIADHCGVFCMTLRHDSILMWSHYADYHRGAVFEFAPDVESDSVLCASKPVKYKNERPLLYRTPGDLATHALTASPVDKANQMLDALIFTKSPEWEYEQEIRLAIPSFVPTPNTYGTLSFAPKELVGLYLGCRVSAADRDEMVASARSLNDAIEIYQAGSFASRVRTHV